MIKSKIHYCQVCGSPTKHTIPDGEEKIRAICTSCGRIHYENPKMVRLQQLEFLIIYEFNLE